MSREIKFRAWDSGVMYESGRIPDKNERYNNDLSVVVSLTGYCYIIQNNGDGNDKIVSLSEYAIPMQFTGLKDKNGKDGYEYDICKDSSDRTWLIIWDDHSPGFYYELQEKPKKFDGRIGKMKTRMQEYTFKEMVIIGNIYENPELLSTPEPGKQ